MIDINELNILILVQLTLTLNQDLRSARSKSVWANYLTKFTIKLDRIWYAVETCWCDQPHSHFISSVQYSRDRPLSVRLDMMIETTKLCIFLYQFQ